MRGIIAEHGREPSDSSKWNDVFTRTKVKEKSVPNNRKDDQSHHGSKLLKGAAV